MAWLESWDCSGNTGWNKISTTGLIYASQLYRLNKTYEIQFSSRWLSHVEEAVERRWWDYTNKLWEWSNYQAINLEPALLFFSNNRSGSINLNARSKWLQQGGGMTAVPGVLHTARSQSPPPKGQSNYKCWWTDDMDLWVVNCNFSNRMSGHLV